MRLSMDSQILPGVAVSTSCQEVVGPTKTATFSAAPPRLLIQYRCITYTYFSPPHLVSICILS
jgi:hypothetical protein